MVKKQHLMEKALWSFGNDFARTDIIFGVDNTLSPHTGNQKK